MQGNSYSTLLTLATEQQYMYLLPINNCQQEDKIISRILIRVHKDIYWSCVILYLLEAHFQFLEFCEKSNYT